MKKEINRRRFIQTSALFGSGVLFLSGNALSCKEDNHPIPAPTEEKKGHIISVVHSSIKVLPEEILTAGHTIQLAGAANEIESFQIVIRGEQSTDDVAIELGTLTSNAHHIDGLTWRQVGYVYVSTFDGHPAPQDVGTLLPGWYPDPLLQRDTPTVQRNISNVIWVDCPIPKGATAGIYTGEISVRIGKQIEKINVNLEVFGFELPDRSSLPSLFSLSLDYLDKVYPNFDETLRKRWFNFLAINRISPTDMYIDLSGREGQLKIQPQEYNTLIDRMNGFVIYPITSTWEDRDASADELIARFEANRPYIDAMINSGKAAQGNGVFYGFDENDDAHFETMKKVHQHIKAIYPQIPIATTSMHIHSAALLEELGIDILVLHITDDIYNNNFADQIRAAGKKVWGYISLQPYHPMPNWRIENPLLDTRVLLSAMAYHERFDGFLYWGVNQYNKIGWSYPKVIARNADLKLNLSITTPTDEYKWLHGDGILLYPGVDGPISSLRMENIRKGLEEYEYYVLLEKKYGKTQAQQWAAKIAPSMKRFSDDVQFYLTVKKQMADLIMNG
ncbi:DUF4091 domain-containing protein [Sphingobacterium chuzhouense]|uniref:DUF4091 domain-containing protein n=1 Tax=Sphingobacterium chuzhouense TaxID=1742264 RepID=A0ABR7XU11_9SPHI|nr:DUF4091 domain-containing protein [Sphingobacterium chuzhouense]MBD1422027.1 DUF4091 domain-containing protein [Sphingobacterium chuzhouense]